ncbi:c8002dbe-5f48-46ee-bd91-ffd4c3e753a1 [Thermothielavioides terrestris]|uniref:C8002dbe-5f48-46ee-bd91-ffd4c3e753a1 n=1 Tax=Thermothielavioides terrestris TaxID=2587410 RepID=A0A446BEE7_9PEZI|nr:c8002dbe-5f48-46ee-bd91-ffd4c3e753a1 [Thermothielavioides terrestris]
MLEKTKYILVDEYNIKAEDKELEDEEVDKA